MQRQGLSGHLVRSTRRGRTPPVKHGPKICRLVPVSTLSVGLAVALGYGRAHLPGTCRLFSRGRLACFSPKEGELIGIVLNLLINADTGRVTAGEAVMEQNGAAAG